jgi:hypothetical protein
MVVNNFELCKSGDPYKVSSSNDGSSAKEGFRTDLTSLVVCGIRANVQMALDHVAGLTFEILHPKSESSILPDLA